MRSAELRIVASAVTMAGAVVAGISVVLVAVQAGVALLGLPLLAGLAVRIWPSSQPARRVGAALAAVSAGVVTGIAGGAPEPMLLLLLLLVIDFGTLASSRASAGVAAVAAAAVAAGAFVAGTDPFAMGSLWSLALVPLVAALTSEIVGGRRTTADIEELESVTVALEEILRLAEQMPAGFDLWSVATAVHKELRAACEGADAAAGPHLLVGRDGVLFAVGEPFGRRAIGLVDDVRLGRSSRTWSRTSIEDLPVEMRPHLQQQEWLVAGLGADGVLGFVLAPASLDDAALDAVSAVLRPAAIAIANVGRFERLEEMALSAARVRLAQDLHDGVAQALTHVRFELELLALADDAVAARARGIRKVADAALLEVRRTVDELRETAPLVERVQRHVELVASFARAEIRLDLPLVVDVDDSTADEVFRIVQESVSNAVRHADATTIHVRMTVEDDDLTVLIADDGRGIPEFATAGLGLSGLRDRARRLGGQLTVRPRRGGGTVVELVAPVVAVVVISPPDAGPAAVTRAPSRPRHQTSPRTTSMEPLRST